MTFTSPVVESGRQGWIVELSAQFLSLYKFIYKVVISVCPSVCLDVLSNSVIELSQISDREFSRITKMFFACFQRWVLKLVKECKKYRIN